MKQAAGTPVLESPTRLNMEWLKLHVDCLEFLRSKRGKPARIALVNSVGRSRERAAEAPNKTILPSGVAMEYSDAVTTLFKETVCCQIGCLHVIFFYNHTVDCVCAGRTHQ